MEEKFEIGYQMRIHRWMRQRGIALEKMFRKSYPPGYEYRVEGAVALLLLGIGILWNFRFFKALHTAVESLYIYVNVNGKPVRTIWEGAETSSFIQVAEGYWGCFIPLFLFLVIMAGSHYFYYYAGSKSIYLMRRLPKRSTLLKSCIQGPLLWAAVAATAAVVFYLLYFGIYLLAMPAESMPRFM